MSTLARVVIDARMVGRVPHGFARYVIAMARGLAELRAASPLGYEPLFLVRPGADPRAFEGFGTHEVGVRFLNPAELAVLPWTLARLRASLYHSPSFASLLYCPCPRIVTVHDLNHLRFGGLKEKVYYERILKPFVRGARAVVTVSEFSARELARWAALEPHAIEVVPNAILPSFFEAVSAASRDAVLARFGLTKGRYFFCLASEKPHKNLAMLTRAHRAYRERHVDGWSLATNVRPGALPQHDGLRHLGSLTDDEVRALMVGAGAVVFPSLYEGYGLPPVEAACMGAPLVVSRIPPHREGLAELAPEEVLWVTPDDTDAWVDAFAQAAAGSVVGASTVTRARLRERFSTRTLGASMDRIYRRVLDGRP